MNQIFDFNRFWRFFKFDMIRTFRSNSTKLISFVISPVCLCLMYSIQNLLFSGGEWENVGVYARTVIFFIVSAAFFIHYSANCYGFLTEKNAGTSWLMIPASTTEKYVTMILNVLIVAPILYITLSLGIDFVYSLIFSDGSGSVISFLASSISEATGYLVDDGLLSPIRFSRASLYFIVQPSFWAPLLTFLLGGIFFRKSKVAKTILCTFAASFLSSILMSMIINILPIDVFDYFENMMEDPGKGQFLLNAIIFLSTAVPCIVLAVAVFFRLKTIKH